LTPEPVPPLEEELHADVASAATSPTSPAVTSETCLKAS
jgi:hypothetical protein